jgi:DNA-binding GntR family transcriptional regulator
MGSRKKPLRKTIHEKIVQDILHGKINAGEKLLESELARKFRVSRTPIREALLQLEREGYITHKKNVGAVVSKISAQTVTEIYNVVAHLESYAIEIVVNQTLNEKDISHIQKLISQMENAASSMHYSEYVQKNLEFHTFFLKRCGNKILEQIVIDLRRRIYRLVSEGSTMPLHYKEYIDLHRQIFEAIVNKNTTEAPKLMKAHLENAGKYVAENMIAFH